MIARGPLLASWWSRPTGWAVALALAALILVAPGYLFWDELIYFHLQGGDFSLLAACRMGHEPFANLGEPLDGDPAPLFRLLTASLVHLAGTAGRVPTVLGWATFAATLLVMLGAGHLVAWETRRLGHGLAAMALVGLSTVIEPAATFYSMGRPLWIALAILAMLVALQNGRRRNERVWIGLAALSAALAALLGLGGSVAGLAGWAYLRASKESRSRRLAWVPIVATIVGAGVNLTIGWNRIWEPPLSPASHALERVSSLARMIPERLILPNLGLDATLTITQGAILCLGLILLWKRSRRFRSAPNPLEACGLMLVVFGSLIAFGPRDQPTDAMTSRTGFSVVAQLGVVLFGLGWWSAGGRPEAPGPPTRPSRLGALALLGVLGLTLTLQTPRALDLLLQKAPPLMESELKRLPIKSLQRFRARFWIGETIAEPQRRALARLERASAIAGQRGFSRDAIRNAFDRVIVPGWPETLTGVDGLDLFPFPESGRPTQSWTLHAALGTLLAPEAPPRPNWIERDDPWPPPRNPDRAGGNDHGAP